MSIIKKRFYYGILLCGLFFVMATSCQTEAASIPVKQTISMSSKKKGQVTLIWKKDDSCTGYQLLMSSDKNFKKNTRTRTFGKSVTKVTVTGLQSNKTYYAKVRGVRTSSSGKKTYGKYSTVKKCKIK